MRKIRQQYKALLAALIGLAITTQFAVVRFVMDPNIADADSPIAFFITLSSIYTGIVLIPLWLYEKWIWKWFNRSIDVSGHWAYTLSYIAASKSKIVQDLISTLPTSGRVDIIQSPFFIRLESGAETYSGSENHNHLASWYSTSADFISDTRIDFSFEFRINSKTYKGVEQVTIHRIYGRPTMLHSQFFFHDPEHRPVAYGEAYYSRPSNHKA